MKTQTLGAHNRPSFAGPSFYLFVHCHSATYNYIYDSLSFGEAREWLRLPLAPISLPFHFSLFSQYHIWRVCLSLWVASQPHSPLSPFVNYGYLSLPTTLLWLCISRRGSIQFFVRLYLDSPSPSETHLIPSPSYSYFEAF